MLNNARIYLSVSAALAIMGLCQADDNELTLDDPLFDQELPVVLSATRLKQPKSETPAAVTVIDHQTITQLGARSIAEILRLVPGMTVGYERGHTPEVGYHALGGENSRHLQVLVDGRSIYKAALARILWTDLPVSIDKISRIEVIRGPNSALYGANSYLAVINIITFHPEDQLGVELTHRQGNHGVQDSEVRFAQSYDELAIGIDLGAQQDNGFEIDSDGEPRYDGHNAVRLSGDLVWHQNDNDFLRFQFGFSNSNKQIDDLEDNEVTPYHFVDVENSFLHATSKYFINAKHEVSVQVFSTHTKLEESWQTCAPQLLLSNELYDLYTLDANYTDSQFLPALPGPPPPSGDAATDAQAQLAYARLFQNGADIVCGYANQDLTEKRVDGEVQFISNFSDELRVVSGFSYRRDTTSSESYFNGSASKNISRVFAHGEYKPFKDWHFNAGVMLERDSMIGNATSPRLAINWLASSNQSVRLIYSEAQRSPDLFEEANVRSYRLRDLTDLNGQPVSVNGNDNFAYFYQHASANGGLDYEKIQAWELGWFYQDIEKGIELDIKLFNDALCDLLEGDTQVDEFDLVNQGKFKLKGIEGQLSWDINASNRIWFTATAIDLYQPTINYYGRSTPKSTLSVNWFGKLGDEWSLYSGFHRYNDWFTVDFERLDMRLSYQFKVDEYPLTAAINYQHRFDDNHLLDLRSVYRNPDLLYASLSLQF